MKFDAKGESLWALRKGSVRPPRSEEPADSGISPPSWPSSRRLLRSPHDRLANHSACIDSNPSTSNCGVFESSSRYRW
jgi:hypothetical protein